MVKLACGCKTMVEPDKQPVAKSFKWTLTHCPFHASTPDVLARLKEATQALRTIGCIGSDDEVGPTSYPLIHACEAAIALAEKKPAPKGASR